MTKTKEPKLENEVIVQGKAVPENPVKEVLIDKESETPSIAEPTQEETKNITVSLEATTAKAVVALFFAVERFIRARNPEVAVKLAAQRIELEKAIAAAEEE